MHRYTLVFPWVLFNATFLINISVEKKIPAINLDVRKYIHKYDNFHCLLTLLYNLLNNLSTLVPW